MESGWESSSSEERADFGAVRFKTLELLCDALKGSRGFELGILPYREARGTLTQGERSLGRRKNSPSFRVRAASTDAFKPQPMLRKIPIAWLQGGCARFIWALY